MLGKPTAGKGPVSHRPVSPAALGTTPLAAMATAHLHGATPCSYLPPPRLGVLGCYLLATLAFALVCVPSATVVGELYLSKYVLSLTMAIECACVVRDGGV